jgi:hypothetical protein
MAWCWTNFSEAFYSMQVIVIDVLEDATIAVLEIYRDEDVSSAPGLENLSHPIMPLTLASDLGKCEDVSNAKVKW